MLLAGMPVKAETIDLLANGQRGWQSTGDAVWSFADGELAGSSQIYDGEKTDPAASAFIVAKPVAEGDFAVHLEVTFTRGRYLGVYLDFSQQEQSGIWMATGHALPRDAPDNEVARGYIKTVAEGFWIVRATGQINVVRGERMRLSFTRQAKDYGLWQDGRLIATYRATENYQPGPLQLRLVNAAATIHRLHIEPAVSLQASED